MTMLDILTQAILVPMATVTASGANCDQVCAATLASFTGVELVQLLLSQPQARISVAQLVAGWPAADPGSAVSRRGCVVVNSAGRVGVTLGRGAVIEPIGRLYAISNDPAARWVSAYLIPDVVYTMPS